MNAWTAEETIKIQAAIDALWPRRSGGVSPEQLDGFQLALGHFRPSDVVRGLREYYAKAENSHLPAPRKIREVLDAKNLERLDGHSGASGNGAPDCDWCGNRVFVRGSVFVAEAHQLSEVPRPLWESHFVERRGGTFYLVPPDVGRVVGARREELRLACGNCDQSRVDGLCHMTAREWQAKHGRRWVELSGQDERVYDRLQRERPEPRVFPTPEDRAALKSKLLHARQTVGGRM